MLNYQMVTQYTHHYPSKMILKTFPPLKTSTSTSASSAPRHDSVDAQGLERASASVSWQQALEVAKSCKLIFESAKMLVKPC